MRSAAHALIRVAGRVADVAPLRGRRAAIGVPVLLEVALGGVEVAVRVFGPRGRLPAVAIRRLIMLVRRIFAHIRPRGVLATPISVLLRRIDSLGRTFAGQTARNCANRAADRCPYRAADRAANGRARNRTARTTARDTERVRTGLACNRIRIRVRSGIEIFVFCHAVFLQSNVWTAGDTAKAIPIYESVNAPNSPCASSVSEFNPHTDCSGPCLIDQSVNCEYP